MYKLIVKYNGYNNNDESGVWDTHEHESECWVKLNVASYKKYMKFSGKFLKLSFFVEKDGVEKEIDYKDALDLWDPKNFVGSDLKV